jgi:hypothetical protein
VVLLQQATPIDPTASLRVVALPLMAVAASTVLFNNDYASLLFQPKVSFTSG